MKRALLLALALNCSFAQTLPMPANAVISGSLDASGAITTKPAQSGTSLPATCGVGELYYKTDATAGSNVYGCTATNTWTVQTGTAIASPLPVANGGTGTASTLTGLVRGSASAMTAAELSGDATTSGSNAVTVAKVNGIAYSGTAAAHSVQVTTTANTTVTAKVLPDCTDAAGNHLNFTQSTDAFSCGTSSATTVVHSFGATFDGGGSAITANKTQYFTVPYACTIQAWNATVDTGTITFKLWKIATGTAIPTVSNVINTSGVGISSNTAIHSTTLSDFTTTTVTANDIVAVTVTAVSGATLASLVIQCQ